MSRRLFAAVVGLSLVPLGCDTAKMTQLSGQKADLKEIYGQNMTAAFPERNPVVFIHGVLGARLEDPASQTVVWGAFEGRWANPATPEGARLVALPMKVGAPLRELHGPVKPVGLLAAMDASIFGLPLPVGAYGDVAKALDLDDFDPKSDTTEIPNFCFFYDWRLSNAENAQRLHAFLMEKRAVMQAYIERRWGLKNHDVKFDLVVHSMGGLVTRYYLRYGDAPLPADGSLPKLTWAGAAHVEKAVIVGTPNFGFVGAQQVLVKGLDFVPTITPDYPAAVMSTHPSWYEMLTRVANKRVVYADKPDEAVELYDPAVWEKLGWGLADPKQDQVLAQLLPGVSSPQERRAIALDHLKKCLANAKQFQAALDVPTTGRPAHLKMYLFAGDAEPTDAVLAVDRSSGAIKVAGRTPGDTVVTRASALMDERVGQKWTPYLVSPVDWDAVYFLRTDHMGTTADPSFLDNLGYIILEAPRHRPTGS